MGRPSGTFSFANMTTGLLANGNNVPNTGNTFAGLLLGYVQPGDFNTAVGELAASLYNP